jgi:hypothetical protein
MKQASTHLVQVKQCNKHARPIGILVPWSTITLDLHKSPTQQIPHTHPPTSTAPPTTAVVPSGFRHSHAPPLPAIAIQHQQRSRSLLVQLQFTPGSSDSTTTTTTTNTSTLSRRSRSPPRPLLKRPLMRKLQVVARALRNLPQMMRVRPRRVHRLQSRASQPEPGACVLRYVAELGAEGG